MTRAVAELDAAGHSASDVVAALFGKESTLRFWTSDHYSSANLVEACRSYNALLSSRDPSGQPAFSAQCKTRTPTRPTRSTSHSAGLSDLFR
ncbi:MAG: hypothetical protein HC802_05720 [Caldilineaceae bacterium]|nr:hypothetical protein [Caldilineaceae bacterium]